MGVACGLTSATFRPAIDQSAARDCEGVVLWCQPDRIIVLAADDEEWVVRRHQRRSPDAEPAIDADDLAYFGATYEREGHELVRLNERSSPEEWRRVYNQCHRW